MDKRFQLSVDDVYNKQFNVDFKGYSANEVDTFLDLIIQDYQEYDRMIANLGEKIQAYEEEINTLKQQIKEFEAKARNEESAPSFNQVDVLKRLSRLEQAVFAKDLTEE